MALVAKILETTLTAGQTTVSFNDSDIPNSLIRVFTTNPDLFPIQQSLSGNVLTVAFEAQSSNVGVALEIVKQGLTVADNLTTESSDQALSAKQGKVLKGLIDDIVIPTVPENITDLDDVAVSDIQDGQVLAWDSVTEKFENVNQSGGTNLINYSTTEQDTGIKWIDDKPIYQKTLEITSTQLTSSETVLANGISNVDNICEITGIAYKTGNGFTPLTTYHSSSAWACGIYNVNRTGFTFFVGNSLKPYISALKITFRYTKTTDSV